MNRRGPGPHRKQIEAIAKHWADIQEEEIDLQTLVRIIKDEEMENIPFRMAQFHHELGAIMRILIG